MKNKIILLFTICMIGILFSYTPVSAEGESKVVIIYSSNQSNDLTQVRILDTIVSHFTSDITITSDEESINLDDYSHVFYLGLINKKLSSGLIQQMERFQGEMVFFGDNVEQLTKRYGFVSTGESETIRSVSIPQSGIKTEVEESRSILKINASTNQEIVSVGDESKPLIIKDKDSYYVGTTNLYNPVGMVIGETLYEVFGKQKNEKKVKYLRLEDIHPKTDAKNLETIAKYLKNHKIPYLVTIIPVYTSTKIKEDIHFSDVPELVKVLQYMQKNGASFILHGYKHQYRETETGEGFEFWDVQNNRPIYQSKDDKVLVPTNVEEQLMLEDYERQYIKEAIENGVTEMIAHNLYPLAFEAPHYAMSQSGYEILSGYFSTYVGQLQITDQSRKSTYGPITSGKPSFLHGMTSIPETMGYIEKDIHNPEKPFAVSLKNMKSLGDDVSQYSDGYLGAFYHPYLGLDTLKEVVQILNSYPNTTWLDLKQLPNKVEVENVLIQSKNGEVTIEKDIVSSDYEMNIFVKNSFMYVLLIGGLLFGLAIYFISIRQKNIPSNETRNGSI
ncbi:DUF2334 domain-containing protein [Paenisporosarcina macmurdoensis]|uniref:DUF2334 domain-containing protein n=1 Tax=Paenisporosarcina macmurdoensis TaxID=212659 RepID=A0ABW1LA92_9BACL